MATAHKRAQRNDLFWTMVYSGAGVSYTEMKQMDLAEFAEAVEAKHLYNAKVEAERKRNQSKK